MNTNRFVFLDLETTGLNLTLCRPIQIGAAITDNQFNVIASIEVAISFAGESHYIGDDGDVASWNWELPAFEMHYKSGLFQQCLKSRTHTRRAADEVASWIKDNGAEQSPLCGANVGAFDRQFLRKYLPAINSVLHYRHLDVTTFGLLGGTLGLDVPKGERKHTALADVLDSVELAKWARAMLSFGTAVHCSDVTREPT